MSIFPRSLRWRLQLWYGALLVAVLCGFGLTAYHLEKARQNRELDGELQKRLAVLLEALRAAPRRDAPEQAPAEFHLSPAAAARFSDGEKFYYAIWLRAPEPVARSAAAPKGITRPGAGEGPVRRRGEWREMFLFAAPVDCVLVGCSVAEQEAELQNVALRLAMVGGGILALGLLGGWWLASRAIRPLEEIGATATRIAAGDLSQRIATAEAESELGRLVAVLNSTFARLEAAFAQQARFTADAAHELRTPIAVLLTQIQSSLVRERPAAEYREALEACERAAQRMRRLIESLLELASFDAGQQPLRCAPCDLAQLAAESLELIAPLAEARGLAVQTDFGAAACSGDRERLGQVLANLLVNAIEYNRPGGSVHLRTRQRDGRAVLVVANAGPGISPQHLPQVFERFHRGDPARTSGHAGLGLAIAQTIAQAHGGTIKAASEPGGETTFTVTLPALG